MPTLIAPALGPVIGGAAGGRTVLAVDLLPQPAGRGGRARLRRAVPARAGLSTRPAASTCPGSCSPGPASRCSCTRCRPARPPAGAPRPCSPPGWPAWCCSPCSSLVELRAAAPMLRLRIYADRLFRATSLQLTFAGGGFMGTLFLVPLLLQNGLGFSAVHSGLSTFTEALGGMIGVQVTSRLYKRVGPRRLMTAGHVRHGRVTIGVMALAGPSRRGLADPAADVLHRLLVRVRDVTLAGRATWPRSPRRRPGTPRPCRTRSPGGRRGRGRAARHRARRDRGGRRPTWPATTWRSSPRRA